MFALSFTVFMYTLGSLCCESDVQHMLKVHLQCFTQFGSFVLLSDIKAGLDDTFHLCIMINEATLVHLSFWNKNATVCSNNYCILPHGTDF